MIRRHAAMALHSSQQLLAALRASQLLSATQLADLESESSDCEDMAYCLQKLVDRCWLTEYQAAQVLADSGDSLVLGQYRILDRLGEGGMGQVYKAEHVLMKRSVAIKIIASRACGGNAGYTTEAVDSPQPTPSNPGSHDPRALERFQQEVQIAAQLDHPNVVRAHDAAEARGLFFLVMEYVDGTDLAARVRQSGPLPVALACDYVRQAAKGLQYAHQRGLVHRDIKPANLLISSTGVVKLLDLGLARLAGSMPGASGKPAGASDLSGLSGTPDYMAPETAQDSRNTDIRSDLYSLGCTFYFLLTGQAPFPGGGWPEKLLRHQLDSAPEVTLLRPDVPPQIAALLKRLMAKDPAGRPSVPAEVAAELEAWLAAHGGEIDPLPALAVPIPSAASMPTLRQVATSHDERDARREQAPTHSTAASAVYVSLPRPRRRRTWPVSFGAAAVLGLILALVLRGPDRFWPGRSLSPTETGLADSSHTADATAAFSIAGSSESFPSLAAAIAAAPLEGTITIHGDGPFLLKPLRLHGKPLTLKAGEGFRPKLQFTPASDGPPWQALFATDRPLRLEGLDLVFGPAAPASGPETAHLVYIENAPLQLVNCTVSAPSGSACVVCRASPSVRFDDCRLSSAALPVCVEIGAAGSEVSLRKTHVSVEAKDGAALSMWAAERGRASTLRLHLEDCTIQAGRALAFGVLPHRIDIHAERNHFDFRQALVSFASSPDPQAWRRATTWEGGANTFDAKCPSWLRVSGAPMNVRDVGDWRALWTAAPPDLSHSGTSPTVRAP